MKKNRYLICISGLFCIMCLCACSGANPETGPIRPDPKPLSQNMGQDMQSRGQDMQSAGQDIPQESGLPGEGKTYLERYQELFVREDAQGAALIYLDDDDIPELLLLKDGEYRLYFPDGFMLRAAAVSGAQSFYWFEYVPCGGLLRVHDSDGQERHDLYLRYAEGTLSTELEVKSADHAWHTYAAGQEIASEEFPGRLSGLGYDELIPCAFLYDSVEAAYENIDAPWDTGKTLEDFVNGRIDALEYVEGPGDTPEKSFGFVMRSCNAIREDITYGEAWRGAMEYIDFDNDGEEELILQGYGGARLFFDVIGDTVYEVLYTGGNTDAAFVAEIDGRNVVVRGDFMHGGREDYQVMEYDSCCGLIDWYSLSASYDSAGDSFEYRGREITVEEFKERRASLHQLPQFIQDIEAECDAVRAMDFTAAQPRMNVTPEENLVYLEAYLQVLKNERTVMKRGEETCYKDLWKAGIGFEELLADKDQGVYYYDDLDGDGKPEFAVKQGFTYIFDYEPEEDVCSIIYSGESRYFKKMTGAGQIWEHDESHADTIRDRYYIINERRETEFVLDLELTRSGGRTWFEVSTGTQGRVDVGEENWKEITAPFFEMAENNEIPWRSLWEVFGELLEE